MMCFEKGRIGSVWRCREKLVGGDGENTICVQIDNMISIIGDSYGRDW